ncbi:23S rRNA (adenine(2503)-C(2))-methyltransferase RlmN [Candidatus Parcubacteria bacterium]|nr:23S rRNA (adenine(2503)-C(2))-methyltransferase RlmN [Candidatus Parcubacteria bacterium]
MNFHKLKSTLKDLGEPNFRYKQIVSAFCANGVLDYSQISNIPKKLAEDLKEKVKSRSFSVEKIYSANNNFSFKARLKLNDGELIETVFLSPAPGVWSACVSSQVGCRLACKFCATGQKGFKRNLSSEEIIDQIIFWKHFLRAKKLNGNFLNIIFMGMGEPFMNWEEVKNAIKQLIDPDFFNFGSRHISVSTSGDCLGIKKIAKEFSQVNLAVSLIFAEDNLRSEYMPINRKFNLKKLQLAISSYLEKTNRKVFLEYVMLKGINDDLTQANNLINFIETIENGKKLLHVNLINYNTTMAEFVPSDASTVNKFKNYLLRKNIKTTIRKSLGDEIKGACGQLAG